MSFRSLLSLVALAVSLASSRVHAGIPCAEWFSLGTIALRGVSDDVRAATFFDFDGAGGQPPRLVLGGSFRVAGSIRADRVVMWNGTSFQPLGQGFSSTVNALAVFNGELYAGGAFFSTTEGTTTRRVAKWNGTAWVEVGTGLNSTVNALTVFNNELVAGGVFLNRGDNSLPLVRVARLSGGNWQPVGAEINSTVNALAVFNNELIAGGSFNGNGILRIARFNGTAWQQLGPGLGSTVNALQVFGTDLIVGGSFSNAGDDSNADRLAKWNGVSFSAVGGVGLSSTVNALSLFGSNLVIGGQFVNVAGNGNSDSVVVWNGAAFSPLSTGINGPVRALAADGATLVAGGSINLAGSARVEQVAIFSGATWGPLVGGDSGEIEALHVHSGQLFAGGSFRQLGNANIDRMAQFNNATQTWQSVLTGADERVRVLNSFGGQLIAGGDFTSIGGAGVQFLARFTGANWQALGSGVDGSVTALAPFGSSLAVGGGFSTAGGFTVNSVALWDGANWSPLGDGFISAPADLAEFQGLLYAVGSFQTSGPFNACVGIARFGNGVWTGVDGGLTFTGSPGSGRALAVFDSKLYVGGVFTHAGVVSASGLAVWDGAVWSASPGWPGQFVEALKVIDNRLYAATGTRVFRLGDSGWTAITPLQFDDTVNTMTGFNNAVVVGGDFQLAENSVVAPLVARFPLQFPIVPALGGSGAIQTVDTFADAVLDCTPVEPAPPGAVFEWFNPNGLPVQSGPVATGAVFEVNGPVLTISGITPLESGTYICSLTLPDCGTDSLANSTVFVDQPPTCAADWLTPFSAAPALGGSVRAVATFDHDANANTPERAAIGGAFSKFGTSPLLRVAQLDGNTWQPLGAGFNGVVNALISGDIDGGGPLPARLYAAGAFSASGATVLNRVGFWNGSAWQPLGAGFNGVVNALVIGDIDGDGPLPTSLIAGGAFTRSGTTVINRIARFDGANWVPIADGFNGVVNTLSFPSVSGALNQKLIVGGAFTRSGTTVINRIASFEATAFQPIGAGFNGPVFAIVANFDALAVGGSFTRSGTTVINRIARVTSDGVISQLGQGFNAPVLALRRVDLDGFGPSGFTLLAGGQFTRSGLTIVNRVGRFSGDNWVSLGLGVDGAVRALGQINLASAQPATPALFVGGDFKTAGGFLQRAAAAFACPNTLPFLRASMPTSRAVIPAGPADIAGLGGLGTLPDGRVDIDDMIAFIDAWIRRDPAADVAGPPLPDGSPSGPDFRFTVDDILAFVSGVATPE